MSCAMPLKIFFMMFTIGLIFHALSRSVSRSLLFTKCKLLRMA